MRSFIRKNSHALMEDSPTENRLMENCITTTATILGPYSDIFEASLPNGKKTLAHFSRSTMHLREQIRIEEEAKAKAKLEAETQAKAAEDLKLAKMEQSATAEAAAFRLTPHQIEQAEKAERILADLAQAKATNVANEAKKVAESGYQSITDEQVITSIVDEFDITFDEACNLIIRVAENMRVAA